MRYIIFDWEKKNLKEKVETLYDAYQEDICSLEEHVNLLYDHLNLKKGLVKRNKD